LNGLATDALTNTAETTGSILISLVGPIRVARTENTGPFTLFGDLASENDFFGQNFPVGEYTLTAIPFTEQLQKGLPGFPLTITFEIIEEPCDVNGGVIATEDPTEVCLNGQEGAGVVNFTVMEATGDAQSWVVTDDAGTILATPETGTIDFSGAGPGVCVVYFLSWEAGNFSGLEPGNNVADLEGCFDLSNGIEVDRYEVNGGTISTEDETTLCLDDTFSNVVNFTVEGSAGEGFGWIVTDDAGNILALPESGSIDFSGAGPGICGVYYARWQPGEFSGLEVGNNIADLTGCFDLSNGIDVNRLTGEDCEEPGFQTTEAELINTQSNLPTEPIQNRDATGRLGLQAELAPLNIQVYPNPSNGNELNLTFDREVKEDVVILLQDVNGRTILNLRQSAQAFGRSFSLPVPNGTLTEGFYFLSVREGTQNPVTRKIVVNR